MPSSLLTTDLARNEEYNEASNLETGWEKKGKWKGNNDWIWPPVTVIGKQQMPRGKKKHERTKRRGWIFPLCFVHASGGRDYQEGNQWGWISQGTVSWQANLYLKKKRTDKKLRMKDQRQNHKLKMWRRCKAIKAYFLLTLYQPAQR